MGDLLDMIGRAIYEDVLARDEFVLTEFNMANAWEFFFNCAKTNDRVHSCVLDIEVKGNWNIVRQLMLDEKGMPIYANTNAYVGRQLKVKVLDDDVVKFMQGEHRQVMNKPY